MEQTPPPKTYTITIELTLQNKVTTCKEGEYHHATYVFHSNLPGSMSPQQKKSLITAMLNDMFP